MTRRKEACYQIATWLLGGHLAWITGKLLMVYLTRGSNTALFLYQTGPLAPLGSLLAGLFVTLPLFLYCRTQHYWLYHSRIHGAALAKVHQGRDRFLGRDWVREAQAALSQHRYLDFLGDYFAQSGPTHWVQNYNTWSLYTCDHEVVRAMYGTQHSDWDIGGVRLQATAFALGKHSIFAVNGAEWKHSRAMIRPAFARNQLADLECTDRHVENFLRHLSQGEDKCFDVQGLLYMFTLDISTDFMFGHSTNTLTYPTAESAEFSRCFDLLLFTAAAQSRTGWLSPRHSNPEADKVLNTCRDFVDAHVANALLKPEKTKEREYVFMDELIKSGASKEEIRSQLLSMIVGGRDTGASALTSMLWVLARRPDVVARIRSEVTSLDGRKPTWEDLRNLRYLNNALKETLRLYSPVPTNIRVANKDTVLPRGGGCDGKSPLFVPKGTSCRFSAYHIHRDKSFYGEDAEEFRPERWDTLRPKWEYIPFAGGPRICIGQQFALTQMLYLLTRLFQTFSSIETDDEQPMLQRVGTTIHLINGCWIRLKS